MPELHRDRLRETGGEIVVGRTYSSGSLARTSRLICFIVSAYTARRCEVLSSSELESGVLERRRPHVHASALLWDADLIR